MADESLFPEEWFAAGVVDAASAADFVAYARRDPERSARSWQWLAFRDYLEENTPLDADRCRRLYALAGAVPDLNLGTAMHCAVLYQRHCPTDVKRAAAASERSALRRTLLFTPRGTADD